MNSLILHTFKYAGINIGIQVLAGVLGSMLLGPLVSILPFIIINWVIFTALKRFTIEKKSQILAIGALICLNTGLMIGLLSALTFTDSGFNTAEFQKVMEANPQLQSNGSLDQIIQIMENPIALSMLIAFSSFIFGLPSIILRFVQYAKRSN